jgi:hypothetical protein
MLLIKKPAACGFFCARNRVKKEPDTRLGVSGWHKRQ